MPLPSFFFFNDTATTEIYTLSLHDALPIWSPTPKEEDEIKSLRALRSLTRGFECRGYELEQNAVGDRKSTRLNSSHLVISYAVFCLKKKTTPPPLDRDWLAIRPFLR